MKLPAVPAQQTTTAAAVALGTVTLLSRTAGATSQKLLVFLHAALKQSALQKALEVALKDVVVTAVGRPADFARALSAGQDAVLTLPLILSANGLKSLLRGSYGGATEEKYALVGSDSPPDPARLASVGALDLLGREGTTAFVHGLLGSQPSVERVSKFEDLLPLLQMRLVGAILLPLRLYGELRATTRLNLAQRELAMRVGLPALASVGLLGNEVIAAVRRLPVSVSKPLGVDKWG